MRYYERGGSDQMGCEPVQHAAFAQRLAHQGELPVLQVAEPAMNQFGAGTGGMRGQVVLLAQAHRPAAPGRIAGNGHSVDPTAHDQDIQHVIHRLPLALVNSIDAAAARENESGSALPLVG